MVQCCCSLERYAYIGIFEQIGNFSDLWAVEGKCSPDFFVILVSFFLLLTLCSTCRLSFSSRCCGELLFLASDCIISHPVCFLSGLRGKECILVMWNLKAAFSLFYGVIRKEVNCCVCSGWFPVYVYFKFSVSSRYCQIEKGYGIVFFVCGVVSCYCVFCLCMC